MIVEFLIIGNPELQCCLEQNDRKRRLHTSQVQVSETEET